MNRHIEVETIPKPSLGMNITPLDDHISDKYKCIMCLAQNLFEESSLKTCGIILNDGSPECLCCRGKNLFTREKPIMNLGVSNKDNRQLGKPS